MDHKSALPPGYLLQEYSIEAILGHGGFGITYRARDTKLEEKLVAIKEYFPQELAVRDGRSTLAPKSGKDQANYRWGLERFLREAQALARFNHPNIVRVLRFIEANNTAYLVMDYFKGQSLGDYLYAHGPVLPEQEIRGIFSPLLDGLRAVHDAGLLHRDIKPDNIYLPDEAGPMLIDFGAARYALGEKSRSLSIILSPGYASFEQYSSRGKQGAWTDIYGIGASMYRCLSGQSPPEAPDRSAALNEDEPDPYVPAGQAARSRYSRALLTAVDAALAFKVNQRPQSARAFQKMLARTIPDTPPPPPPPPPPWPWKGIVAGLALGATGIWLWNNWTDLTPGAATIDDNAAYDRARRLDSEPAYRDYLNNCEPLCAHEQAAQSALERLARQEKLAARERRLRDDEAFLAAKQENTIHALETYLAGCGAICAHAHEAREAIQTLREPQPGQVIQDSLSDGGKGPEMVVIAAGEFTMGYGEGDEKPTHTVRITKSFALGRYEVRNAEYLRCVKADGCKPPLWLEPGNKYNIHTGSSDYYKKLTGDNQPVAGVSWNDAEAYAKWLTKQSGKTYRLPSEAEWEYAARAGSETNYSWGDAIGRNRANCDGCGSRWDKRVTAPVGSFAENKFGLFDMHGNVWEWVEGCWHDNYNGAPGTAEAWTTDGDCSPRVVRGGSWGGVPGGLRSAGRFGDAPVTRGDDLGFRLSRM